MYLVRIQSPEPSISTLTAVIRGHFLCTNTIKIIGTCFIVYFVILYTPVNNRCEDLIMSIEQTEPRLAERGVGRVRWLQMLGVAGGLVGIGEVAAAVGNLVQRDYGMAAAYGSFAAAALLEGNQCLTVAAAETPITDQV